MASVPSGTDSSQGVPRLSVGSQSGFRRQLAAETVPAGRLHMYHRCVHL